MPISQGSRHFRKFKLCMVNNIEKSKVFCYHDFHVGGVPYFPMSAYEPKHHRVRFWIPFFLENIFLPIFMNTFPMFSLWNFQYIVATSKFMKAVSSYRKSMLTLILILLLWLAFLVLELFSRLRKSTDFSSNYWKNWIIFISVYWDAPGNPRGVKRCANLNLEVWCTNMELKLLFWHPWNPSEIYFIQTATVTIHSEYS